MKSKAILLGLLLSYQAIALEPRAVPSFFIDFDVPASRRYDEVFNYFKAPLLEMEHYFYYSIPPATRSFYSEGDNLEKFRLA